jgi:hypothetical protein
MSERDDLRRLVGDDVAGAELERLRPAHEALRSVPAPPPVVPRSLDEAVARLPARTARRWTRPRMAATLAFAAALAAVFFGLGAWLAGGDSFQSRTSVAMQATANAPASAQGLIKLGALSKASLNYTLELEVSGLPKLPKGGYYVLWLAKGKEYAATCGTFNVGGGTTQVYMNVSYDLRRYDAWVVTAQLPGQAPESPHPWLLQAKTSRA